MLRCSICIRVALPTWMQVQAPARLRGRRFGVTGRAPRMLCRPSALQRATCCPRCVCQPPPATRQWGCDSRAAFGVSTVGSAFPQLALKKLSLPQLQSMLLPVIAALQPHLAQHAHQASCLGLLTAAPELPLQARQLFHCCTSGCCRQHSSANQHAWLRWVVPCFTPSCSAQGPKGADGPAYGFPARAGRASFCARHGSQC